MQTAWQKKYENADAHQRSVKAVLQTGFQDCDCLKFYTRPGAYLVPVGMDVMLVPNSTDLDSRE